MDAKSTLPPTEEQSHILSLHRSSTDNLLIEAFAGTGKTTMLEMLIEQCRDNVLVLAFNTRIRDAMEERLEEKTRLGWPLPPTKIKTLNGLGHSVWTQAVGKVNLNKTKTQDILRQLLSEQNKEVSREGWEIFWDIVSAVGLAKSLGYVPDGKYPTTKRLISADNFFPKLEERPGDLGRELIDSVLLRSIRAAYAGTIDFNDQVYMPALFGGTYPKFPTVLIDELQDLSPTNHEMLYHLRQSRLIAVGDDAQSIYQFRGAQQGGMEAFAQRHSAKRATLSVSFRCPRAVCEAAQWRVPIRWIKEGGRVARLRNAMPTNFPDDCAVICRNNAPLFALALRLLTAGRSVSVSGSDIGPRLLAIMRKLGPENLTQAQTLSAIENWRAEKLAKASTTADDIADCMRVFAQYGSTLSQAIGYAQEIFKQTGTITLLTGHKAKGLEYPVVFHLDPWLCQDTEQDRNLRYVIQTRAMETYYEIESREIRW